MSKYWQLCFIVFTALFFESASFAYGAGDPRIAIIGANPEGSADGKIPNWEGGLAKQEKAENGHHIDLFSEEKPLFIINKDNIQDYLNVIPSGTVALLNAYPETFNIPVYTSHRTTNYPDWYYENTSQRPNTHIEENGSSLINAYPGVAFPAPKTGLEAIWNHLTRWRGQSIKRTFVDAIVYPDGALQLTKSKQNVSFELFRYLDPSEWKPRLLDQKRQVLLYYQSLVIEPARLAGGSLLAIDYVDQHSNPRKAWAYDVGQKRVMRMPYITHDNSALMSESLRTADDTDLFNGSPDRYDWKLLERKAMLVPYNAYRVSDPSIRYEQILIPHHINPAVTRFEYHRVWVVEAKLKAGFQHIYSARTFYIDEDSWSILQADQYDNKGHIWRVNMCHYKLYYEVPANFCAAEVIHDLKRKAYYVSGLTNEERGAGNISDPNPSASQFTPASLRAGARR